MNTTAKVPYSPYLLLRKEIDALSTSLEKEHSQFLFCKKGCDLCCMAISVFPIEFYAIKAELATHALSELPNPLHAEDCRFLVDHTCTIYRSRPVICRTHGLPLLYMNSEGTEWELSHCELNFGDYDIDEFEQENTFPLDRINSQLYRINKEFVAGFKGGKYSETDRIPLAELIVDSEN